MSARKSADISKVDRSPITKRHAGKCISHTARAEAHQLFISSGGRDFNEMGSPISCLGPAFTNSTSKPVPLEIVKRKGTPNPHVGRNWHLAYLARNPELKVKLSSSIDRGRVAACTPPNIMSFFDLFVQDHTREQHQD
jgi:chorismate synthase